MKKKHDAYNAFLTFGQGAIFTTAILLGLLYNRAELAMIEMVLILIIELFKEK